MKKSKVQRAVFILPFHLCIEGIMFICVGGINVCMCICTYIFPHTHSLILGFAFARVCIYVCTHNISKDTQDTGNDDCLCLWVGDKVTRE